jgi:hypothetical protein
VLKIFKRGETISQHLNPFKEEAAADKVRNLGRADDLEREKGHHLCSKFPGGAVLKG